MKGYGTKLKSGVDIEVSFTRTWLLKATNHKKKEVKVHNLGTDFNSAIKELEKLEKQYENE